MHISVSEQSAIPFDESLTNPAVRQAVLNQELNGRVGGRYVVTHLTSERGRELNGRSCLATGHDESRLIVRMEDDDSLMKSVWVVWARIGICSSLSFRHMFCGSVSVVLMMNRIFLHFCTTTGIPYPTSIIQHADGLDPGRQQGSL